ncbi:MAG: hypothetical protein KGL39_04445 [Patescibacteria group bacterium]|nr:hypothetical protein [Patescibacteria group bacterium]
MNLPDESELTNSTTIYETSIGPVQIGHKTKGRSRADALAAICSGLMSLQLTQGSSHDEAVISIVGLFHDIGCTREEIEAAFFCPPKQLGKSVYEMYHRRLLNTVGVAYEIIEKLEAEKA